MDKLKGIRTLVIGVVYFVCVTIIVKVFLDKLPIDPAGMYALIKDFLSFMELSLIIVLGGKIWAENKKNVGGN